MASRTSDLVAVALVVGVFSFGASILFSDDGRVGPSKEEMQKKVAEMGQPAPEHKDFTESAGTWDVDVTMTDPLSGEVKTSKGISKMRPILNGLYRVEEFTGDFEGKPFEGFALVGFSKEKGRYFGLWADSMSTTPELLWGTADASGKTVTFDGQPRQCPMGEYVPRWVVRKDDADHSTFEHWAKFTDSPDYKKELEIKYARRK